MKGESHKMAKIRSSIRLKDTEQRPTDQSHAIEELSKGWLESVRQLNSPKVFISSAGGYERLTQASNERYTSS